MKWYKKRLNIFDLFNWTIAAISICAVCQTQRIKFQKKYWIFQAKSWIHDIDGWFFCIAALRTLKIHERNATVRCQIECFCRSIDSFICRIDCLSVDMHSNNFRVFLATDFVLVSSVGRRISKITTRESIQMFSNASSIKTARLVKFWSTEWIQRKSISIYIENSSTMIYRINFDSCLLLSLIVFLCGRLEEKN